MKKFFSFIIRQSVAVVLIVVFVLAFGVYATIQMPVNLLPDINVPMVCVQVIYAGNNAQTVDDKVTVKLEEGLSAISGVTSVDSYSYDNLSAVVLSFDYGTDTSEKQTDIKSKLEDIDLPSGATWSVYDIDLNAEALATLSVTSDKTEDESANLEYAYAAASALADKLSAIDGVESVEVKGGADSYYVVQPFGGLELIVPLIYEAYQYDSALDIPLGSITEDDGSIQIRNKSSIATESDIGEIPVTLPSALVQLLAQVKEGIVSQIEQVYLENIVQSLKQLQQGIFAQIQQILDEKYPTLGMTATDKFVIDIVLNSDEYKQAIRSGLAQNPSTASMTFSDEFIKLILTTDLTEEITADSPIVIQAVTSSEDFLQTIRDGLKENSLTADVTFSDGLIKFILGADFTAVNSDGGLVVKVSDVANVGTKADYSSYVYYSDGKLSLIKGAIVEVYKSNGANSSAVVDDVKKAYAAFQTGDGAAYSASVKLLDDQSEFISDSISNVLVSMIIGGVLAIIVIFLFLKKVRLSLIIAITMPLSVLAALICLFLMGITLNMVSLGGLAVGIGMLVDNSIVVIESISKHRDKDKTAFEAAVDGTVEVGGALFGSTLTTVCVFIPIIFTGGLTAEIFTDLSWAVIFSLAFSLIVAVTVIPALYALFGRRGGMLKGGRFGSECDKGTPERVEAVAEANGTVRQTAEAENVKTPAKKSFGEKLRTLKEPKIMNGLTGFYGKVLPAVLNRKLVSILTAIVIFGASVGLLFVTGTEFLPSIDKGQIEINMSYGSTSRIESVEQDVFAFAELVRGEVKNIDYISVSVGKNGLLALTDTGIITVQLTTNRNTDKVVRQIRALEQSDASSHPERTVTVKEVDGVVASLTSGSSDMSVTIVGEDINTLKTIASEIKSKLEEKNFYSVTTTATESSTEYDLVFDRMSIEKYGLDYQTVVLTLYLGMTTYSATVITVDGESRNLYVTFDGDAITDKQSLENFVVGFSADGAVKLSDICTVKSVTTESCIRRSNGNYMISVSAGKDTDTGSATSEMQSIAASVIKAYDGYSFKASGISSYLSDAFSGLAVALVISFFLLFAVMAVQFGSAIKPLIIMASIPFSFTGGFIALVVTGTSLNVVSFIGLIMLMGVVVNNAIVMLEKIKQLHEEGMPHYIAVQEACKTRLRPILMTTLTTILALIPMAIGVGQGSELMQPLGIVVIGGLLIGTLVTLVLVPAVYCAAHRLSAKNPDGKKRGGKVKAN